MGRWGEEEKKSKGLIGCAIALTILLATSWTFYHNYARLENRRSIEKGLHQIVNGAFRKTEADITKELLEYAEEHEIPLAEEDIEINKTQDNYGNWIVKARIQFPMEIDLYFTTFPVQVPIVEDVTLIQF